MNSIEEKARIFINILNTTNDADYANLTSDFLSEIKQNISQIKEVTHFYLVSKVLYHILNMKEQENISLSYREFDLTLTLLYYYSLKNYLINNKVEPASTFKKIFNIFYDNNKYPDYISCCALGFHTTCGYGQYLVGQILSTNLKYRYEYANKQVLDQLQLFGGIIKETKDTHTHIIQDTRIYDMLTNLIKKVDILYQRLPTGKILDSYKIGCIKAMQDITSDIERELCNPMGNLYCFCK